MTRRRYKTYENPKTGEWISIEDDATDSGTFYGFSDKFDFERETKKAAEAQIKKWGFTEFVGVDKH